ncbi:MAG: hypothetical protein LCH57_01890 [Proteobacteria bacterium]|nr:hypothetical protein [Pseudomonadota bacterium]
MPRQSKPASAPPPADTASSDAVLPLTDVPAVAALISLFQALVAVARFPSSPMPMALIDQLTSAQEGFVAALSEPFLTPLSGSVDGLDVQADAYDDKWIRDAFSDLQISLKERFGGLDASLSAAVGQINERLTRFDGLADRVAAIEAVAGPADKKA